MNKVKCSICRKFKKMCGNSGYGFYLVCPKCSRILKKMRDGEKTLRSEWWRERIITEHIARLEQETLQMIDEAKEIFVSQFTTLDKFIHI